MNNKKILEERKAELRCEALIESALAKRGSFITKICLLAIAVPRISLAFFEIIYYSVQSKPSQLYIPFLTLIALLMVYVISKGGKGFTYVLLVEATVRLILFFSLIYPNMPQATFTEIYSFSLFAILIIQFISAILLLTNSRCDAYFTMLQRITIKAHGEAFIKTKDKKDA